MRGRIRAFFCRLNDPRTRTGTAFWAGLGASTYDIIRHGASWPSVALLAGLAGIGVASALATGRADEVGQ